MRYCAVALICSVLLVGLPGSVSLAADEAVAADNLTPSDIEQLNTQKILITPMTYRQIFEPYLKSDLPIFITTDSVVNAFHVLFDDATFRFEQINAGRLPEIVRLLWTRCVDTARSPGNWQDELDPETDIRSDVA